MKNTYLEKLQKIEEKLQEEDKIKLKEAVLVIENLASSQIRGAISQLKESKSKVRELSCEQIKKAASIIDTYAFNVIGAKIINSSEYEDIAKFAIILKHEVVEY